MILRIRRGLSLALLAIATSAVAATAQTANPDDILYILPFFPYAGDDARVETEIKNLRARLGPEGPYVKLGFSAYVYISMDSWMVDTADPGAIRAQLAGTIAQIDNLIQRARTHGFPLALMFQTRIREGYDAAQSASEAEDVRNMMWFSDNELAAGWWTHTRYARKQQAVQEAYIRELGKIVAERMRLYPDTLVAASGDGEQELATARGPDIFADYSPFAVAEFRDWIRLGGLYATGAPFAGQGYSLGSRYAGDATPGTDSNGDGHTLNGDFNTSFQTWSLLHFDWSLTDAVQSDPKAIALTAFNTLSSKLPAQIAGGFDAPRVPKAINAGDAWWDLWVLFKQTMLHRHNLEFAKWMTTSADGTGATVPPARWFSNQIPADYLFNGSPEAPNERWHSSMSSWWTADVSPYGSLGITAFNVDFVDQTPPFVARTLANVAPQIAVRDLRWGLIEWHPGQLRAGVEGVSTNLEVFRSEMALIERYRPALLQPFYWSGTGPNQVENTGFETALNEMVARIRNGLPPDPRISPDVADGATITLPLALTGSAVDLGKIRGSGHGTGMDRVDITVVPRSGGSPLALAATYGVARTDTAASFGTQFAKAGFTATVPRLAAGVYDIVINGRSTVGSAATTSKTITVSVTYPAASSPATLQFGATRAGGGGLSSITGPQVITAAYGGIETPAWTATGNQPWMQVTSGPGSGQFTVAIINPDNVIGASTSLTGAVTVSASNLAVSITVPVRLTVTGSSTLPFGSFDTPFSGATPLSGSLGVTGWALDDIGVDRVEIWRDLVPGETTPPYTGGGLGNGKVFIANTIFVEGARPDVANAFPDNPQAHRAGWGYLMLTQGLWNQGNGTFTLYAFAYDLEGRSASLGSKTVVVNNASAIKPFGALDTPIPGQTVTENFWNFGWALTPNATPTCTIDNGNVFVSIDSGSLIPVSYGDRRDDIAGAFPGFSNGSGAGGAYFIDISALTNGLHQIGWYIVDSCGRAEGVGSRFFHVLRAGGTGGVAAAASSANSGRSTRSPGHNPVMVTRDGGHTQVSHPNSDGVSVIAVAQQERIELVLPAGDGTDYEGYQVVQGGRRALPAGSSLDTATGAFSWQPAPGFLGSYDLEFAGGGNAGLTRVRVVVGPAGRLVIDTPPPGSTVARSFVVAGWALDLAGTDGTGVDAVHVWAYPIGIQDAKPILAGEAIYGGRRPDVAALYGAAFGSSAYDVTVSSLPAGTYDLVVYARSAATGTFDAAQVVRVTVQ